MIKDLERDLAAVIAKHCDWLDGRTWQKVSAQMGEALFEAGDLDPQINVPELVAALEKLTADRQ